MFISPSESDNEKYRKVRIAHFPRKVIFDMKYIPMKKGVTIDPTCVNIGRPERTLPTYAFKMGAGDLNSRNPF